MTKTKWRWITGSLLAFGLASAVSFSVLAEEKGKEENEVKISVEQLPAVVKQTMMKESEGNPLSNAEKETKKGTVVYEADAKIGKNNYEIKVAEDGTLLSKKLDDEEEEKDEKKKDEKKVEEKK